MSFLEFPIKRYPFSIVIFLCLVAFGWFAFVSVPREEDPYIKFPGFLITAVDPGADPKDLERLVTKPIEDRLAELDEFRRMESLSQDGVSVITVEFNADSDSDKKYDEVTREINALRPSLPAELASLEVRKLSPGLVNIVEVALVSDDAPYRELEDAARELKDTLKAVDGVRTAESWAFPARELRVQVDLKRMGELGVQPAQVIQALQSENANVPGGVVDIGSRSFTLKSSGSYSSLDQVRDTVVASVNGRAVRVNDVAQVSWQTQAWSYIGRFNGKRAVFVTANQKEGYNILDVTRRVETALQRFEQGLPKRIQLQIGFEQAHNVANRLDHLYQDLAIAIGLVMLTLLPLGWPAASIVMVSIPLSFAFGFTALYFLNYSLNQISIAAFVVALGLLVDDSIVVTENIARHLREGASRSAAALAGTRQIFIAILGCTATLIFAFLPLMALPGNPGKFIRVLPFTVVATIVGSLIVALFIIPFLASRVLSERDDPHGSPLLQRVMGAIHRYYRPALHYCLERPKSTALVAIAGSLLLSAALVPVVGSSLFPKADTPQFLVTVETPNGTSFAATDQALRFVEARLARMPAVAGWFANMGHGNPQVYYNVVAHGDALNYAEVFVQLHSYDTRRTPAELDQLRADLAHYPGARIYVKEFINGPRSEAPIVVRVIGSDLDVIDKLAARVEQIITDTPGTRAVENPLKVARTNLKLEVDSQKANLLGVPTVDFDRAVRLSVSGIPVGTYKDTSGEQYDIVVRTAMDGRPDLDALERLRVPSASGATLPLSQLARLRFEKAPTQIARYNRERSVSIDSDVQNGYNTAKVTAAVVKRLNAMQWPRGYRFMLGGDAETSKEAFGGIGSAIIVAVFGLFAILVLEFGNFKSTLIVLTVVPLGVLGGLLMLLATGNSISFTASIGFIALIGIEIKNSILFVDFTNQLRAQGVDLEEAIERAGEIRFLPILLTSATAVGGLMPLAVQNVGLYSPMAWVIIGGLISSTLLTRLVTPVMYKLIPPEVETDSARTAAPAGPASGNGGSDAGLVSSQMPGYLA